MNNENIPTAMNTDNPTDAAISLGCYNSSTRQKLSLLKVAIAERFPSSAWILDEAMDTITALSARVETLEAGMSQYLKDGQTPLERMEQDQADILGLMKLLQKEKELTEKLRWALSDAVTTNTESCRERDAALHRIEAAAKAERDRIVAWLRDDARLTEIEARRILGNLTTLTQADTDDWAKLILMKHGIADALEKRP